MQSLHLLLTFAAACGGEGICAHSRVAAKAPESVMLADAGAPAVLAGAPDAVMLADAGPPAVFAPVPLADARRCWCPRSP